MTTIKVNMDKMTVRVQGHAGAGEKGHDLVCAGVSALTNALLARAGEFEGRVWIGGDAEVEVCFPEMATPASGPVCAEQCSALREGMPIGDRRYGEEMARACRCVIRTVTEGWLVLAEQYPEHVRVELEE